MYQAPKDIVKPPEDASILSTNELFVGGTAILALAMSAMQQIKKKKEQLEQQKCCSDSKISINKLETDIKELQAKEKESNKTLHAEIYEQYKELKELRDDSQEVKEILSKVIDKLK
jgi:predicted phage-related endonuclease